jgi:nicotinamidase-related amidase
MTQRFRFGIACRAKDGIDAMTWTLTPDDWTNAALLTIDVQRDFITGPAAVGGTAQCLGAMGELVRMFRAAHRPVIHAVRLYAADGSDAEPFRAEAIRANGPLVLADSRGAELAPELAPSAQAGAVPASFYDAQPHLIGPREWLLYKPRWDAFHHTGLEAHLRSLKVKLVVVCGCNLPNCPRATLFGASNRDLRTVLARDATSQVTAERLADLALIGTEVMTVDAVGQALA